MAAEKPLIQEIKESIELTQNKGNPLRTYYTCVRFIDISHYMGGTCIPSYYAPGPWSCMKGWFEIDIKTFYNTKIEVKVLNYCRFRNTKKALNKALGEDVKLYTPKNK